MLLQRFRAMGTGVVAVGETEVGLAAVRALFEQVEACCSRFRAQSDLSRANADLDVEVALPPLLAEVVGAADTARTLTGGLVDAGVGRAVAEWGYDGTFSAVCDRRLPPGPLPAAAPWSLSGGRLRRPPDTYLDLGGIAKGWTCDRAVEQGLAVVVSAGGDVRSSDGRTTVEILGGEAEVAARVHLGVGALATSSVLLRRWKVGAAQANHIIDPRIMAPVESPAVSASAVAATALEAEAAAKAILILGSDGLAWAGRQAWLRGAVAIWHDGSVFATAGTEVAA